VSERFIDSDVKYESLKITIWVYEKNIININKVTLLSEFFKNLPKAINTVIHDIEENKL
jgi:hypothetical protein